MPEKISRNDTLLVKYAYLSDGMKASALNTAGTGLVYRGSMSFRKDTQGVLSFESAALVPNPANATLPYTDFGARHYSPSLRRWLVPDPLSEKYYDVSPYTYCAGDPVNYVDEDGKVPHVIVGAIGGAVVWGVNTKGYSTRSRGKN